MSTFGPQLALFSVSPPVEGQMILSVWQSALVWLQRFSLDGECTSLILMSGMTKRTSLVYQVG